jgi:hypothetical protein
MEAMMVVTVARLHEDGRVRETMGKHFTLIEAQLDTWNGIKIELLTKTNQGLS